MSDIPLRALKGRKYRNLQTGGYAPLNREDDRDDSQHSRPSGSSMSAAIAAASAAANYNKQKKGKGKQRHYRDDDLEEEENLLSRGEYGDDDGDGAEEGAALLRHEPSLESVSCTKNIYAVL
jgi:hypothetical protein